MALAACGPTGVVDGGAAACDPQDAGACPSGQICVSGRCDPASSHPCTADNPGGFCPDGQVCLASGCAPVVPACANAVRDGAETGVDCGGGTCPACGAGAGCASGADCASGVCAPLTSLCAAPACDDGVENGTETDVDCGGACATATPARPCAAGGACQLGVDCASGVCEAATDTCAAPACTDSVQNGGETGADCGGPACPACAAGGCVLPSDCASGVCDDATHTCAAPACDDGVKNGDETGADCGGACAAAPLGNKCATGSSCATAADCVTDVCDAGECRPIACDDGVENGGETGTDCGGPLCAACVTGGDCQLGVDCASGVCRAGTCRDPACDDEVLNQGEVDVDCGGPCSACADGRRCTAGADCASTTCVAGRCASPSCSNAQQDGTETGVDCGGPACPACAVSLGCEQGGDCASGVCNGATHTCAAPTCSDGVQNGGETGVDCGAVACGGGCADGLGCATDWDCLSRSCALELHACAAPTCADGRENGSETGVDCGGGACGLCDTAAGCAAGGDCQSGVCDVATSTCAAPVCTDGVQNGDETGVDCGGACASASPARLCGVGEGCTDGADCVNGACVSGVCAADHCTSGTPDGGETGVDCGGGECPPCGAGGGCASGADCVSGACGPNNACGSPPCACQSPSCTDTVKNGGETDVDCGGGCGGCASGGDCLAAGDCQSGVCTGGRCQAPSCADVVFNGGETDVDCGGATCSPCGDLEGCALGRDCASGVCTGGVCQRPACVPVDGVRNGRETDVDCGGADCPDCADGSGCALASDCDSRVCRSQVCQAPACSPPDGVRNGGETDVDCGGDGCPVCAQGQGCLAGGDCATGVCGGDGRCAAPACNDGVKNGDETDRDCGGSCADCAVGQTCTSSGDCATSVCSDGPTSCTAPGLCCQAATCLDLTQNGDESDVDCGGSCPGCDVGERCVGHGDCDSDVCTGGFCAPNLCGDGTVNGTEVCDDGNRDDCQGNCNAACTAWFTPSGCGDDVVCGAEACDDGNAVTEACAYGRTSCVVCDATCQPVAGATSYCGDSAVDGGNGETCDDGNAVTEACPYGQTSCVVCNATCQSVPGATSYCGDSAVDGGNGEACDDGNNDECAGDCNADCTRPITGCGDGVVCGAEECDGAVIGQDCAGRGFDGGNLVCSGTCVYDDTFCYDCGNGAKEASEVCDGADLGGATCASVGFSGTTGLACNATCDGFDTSGCPRCGNDAREGAEVCDGGDLAGQDCASRGFDTGRLACNPTCGAFDASNCCSQTTCGAAGGRCLADGSCDCGLNTWCAASNACKSLLTDPDNCGSCGNVCPGGTACSAGQCSTACQAPLVRVGGLCVDTNTDNARCGGSLVNCTLNPVNKVCSVGVCVAPKQVLPTPAKCAGGGPAIDLNEGTASPPVPPSQSCAGDLASVSFRWALCSCTSISLNQNLFTDGFNSSLGPYQPRCEDGTTLCTVPGSDNGQCGGVGDRNNDGLTTCADDVGAGIGANGMYGNNQTSTIWGTLWWAGTAAAGLGTCSVQQDLHANGAVGASSLRVRGSQASKAGVFVNGNITASGRVERDLYQSPGMTKAAGFTVGRTYDNTQPVVVPEPCDCSAQKLIDVAGIVDAHACTQGGVGANKCNGDANDNFTVGLSPDLYNDALGGSGGRLDLPCGHYYLSAISDNVDVTIVVHGRTAIYVGGHIDMGAELVFQVADNAELDLFVKGGICDNKDIFLGSPSFPKRTRVYVAGGNIGASRPVCSTNASFALDLSSLTAAANVYAPWGKLAMPQTLNMYGGLFVGAYDISQTTEIHFDTGVVDAGETCPRDCGNGRLDAGEECDGDLLAGATCVALGYDGGTLRCTTSCAYDPGLCMRCGDGTANGAEQCDGDDLNGVTCEALGFDGGALACGGDCALVTSGCTLCGNGVRESPAEECDRFSLGGQTCVSLGLGFEGGVLGCGPTCEYDTSRCARCGDGEALLPEQCDGVDLNGATCQSLGYESGALLCNDATCRFDTSACTAGLSCGDGVKTGNEQCDGDDFGSTTCQSLLFGGGTLACTASCTIDTTGCCGDGVKGALEGCDGSDLGGNTCGSVGFQSGSLSCRPDCVLDTSGCAECGNGAIEAGEACDGANLGGKTCTNVGLGFDGGALACDACALDTSGCRRCGNDVLEPGEACDTSRIAPNACELEGFTGGTASCNPNCTVNTSGCTGCGDGVVDAGEQCDGAALGGQTCVGLGHDGGTLACAADCAFDVAGCTDCGDSAVELPEQCDTGDLNGATCQSLGYDSGGLGCDNATCTFDTSGCAAATTCGNGLIEGSEQCDGAALGGKTCQGQGFGSGVLACTASCTLDTAGCCGDGVKGGLEECDGAQLGGATCTSLGRGFVGGTLGCTAACAYDTSGCWECSTCRDCNNQACVPATHQCGECVTDADCCAPFLCFSGTCMLF